MNKFEAQRVKFWLDAKRPGGVSRVVNFSALEERESWFVRLFDCGAEIYFPWELPLFFETENTLKR